MLWQVLGVRRRAMLCQIIRGGHNHLALLVRDRNGDHVLLNHLTEPDTGIESLGHDVELLVRDGDVEADVGVGKPREPASSEPAQELLGDGGVREAQPCRWVVAQFAYGFHGCAEIVERWLTAGRSRSPASVRSRCGSCAEQGHTHPLLKPPDGWLTASASPQRSLAPGSSRFCDVTKRDAGKIGSLVTKSYQPFTIGKSIAQAVELPFLHVSDHRSKVRTRV
jgi:hypothetical protein